jgi:RnfABCDGE-type electron transport complex B subunit
MDVTTIIVLFSGITMLMLAVGMSAILGWANQKFHVEVDPKVAKVQNALPAANCGGCGFIGCADFAEAVAAGKAPVDGCPPGGPAVAKQVAEIMGVEVKESWPYKAVIHCAADYDARLGRMDYDGEQTCAAANMISGVQGCTYGCLGFADCVRACDYDAMEMVNGLPKIIYDNCVGCRACAEACPRNIISMVPFKTERMLVVACSNQDFAGDVKKVCKVGCIGCKACAKASDLVSMEGKLPRIDYSAYLPSAESLEQAVDKCPMESLLYVGKPSREDVEKTKDEELPQRIEADFETTVDKTEWWG